MSCDYQYTDGKRIPRPTPQSLLTVHRSDRIAFDFLANKLRLSGVDTFHVAINAMLDAVGRPDWLPRPETPITRRKPPRRKSTAKK